MRTIGYLSSPAGQGQVGGRQALGRTTFLLVCYAAASGSSTLASPLPLPVLLRLFYCVC